MKQTWFSEVWIDTKDGSRRCQVRLNNFSRTIPRSSSDAIVVSEYDQFYFQMSMVTIHTCRLLTIYHLLRSAAIAYSDQHTESWYQEMKPRALRILSSWGKEAVNVTEAVLVAFLQADKRLVNTTPDTIFHMIGFASGFLVGVKFLLIKRKGVDLLGSSDKLLSRTLDLLSEASFSNDHAATRCAHLVHTMITAWERRHMEHPYVDAAPLGIPPTPPYSDANDSQYVPGQSQSYPTHSIPFWNPPLASHHNPSGAEATLSVDSDIFQDPGFWASFMGAHSSYPDERSVL